MEGCAAPVWNLCFVHAGCTPENIVACAKTKIDVKALDFLAPTSNSGEKFSTLGVTSMLKLCLASGKRHYRDKMLGYCIGNFIKILLY